MSASAPSTAAPAASAANAPAPSTDSAAGAQGQAAAPQSSPSAALAPAAGNKVTPPYASGSLYVGDLTADVTEALLFDTFNAVGPVASVRVCRDAATRRSLGYAYVNFINLLDAERALDTMNFTAIKGRPCRIMWSHRDPSLRKSGVGNIFVKNLSKSIDNKALFDTFSVFGNILSCKVAVNAKRESLGYGFVQFGDAEAAQNAIDQVNGMSIAGEKVSVQAFKSKKERMGGSDAKKQYTNVYVKNLPMDFNKKKLDDLFGKYGAITSSTLSMYTAEEWKEKLENDERRAKQKKEKEEKAAAEAAKDGKPAAEPKKDGETGAKDGKPAADKSSPTASEANKEFKGDRCKGFGFVNFTTAAQAQAAVDGLNGTELGGKKLFVARAQKKEERERELREKFEAFKAERQKKYAGVNLYVKNLADTIDEKKLQTEFAKFGSITSLKIMHDDKKKSRGFGFVCFSSPDEATKAVTEMNGRMVDGKPLYVALAQRKEVRRAQLEQQYAARQRGGGGGRDNGNGPANGMAGQNGMFQPGPFMYPAGPNQFGGGRGFFPNQGMQPRRVPYPQQQPGQPFPPQVLYGVPPQNPMNPGMMNPMGFARGQPMGVQYQLMPAGGAKGGMPMGRGGAPMGGPGPNQGPRRGGGRGNPRGGMQQGGGRGGAMGGPMPGGRGAGAGRGGAAAGPGAAQPMKAPTAPAAAPEPAATEPLTASMLAAAPEDTRKQMIGERLFPLIQSHQPKLAGKITGMLLEMDNGELLHLLESQSSLMEKITEAINVLRDSEHEEAGMAVADGAAPTSA